VSLLLLLQSCGCVRQLLRMLRTAYWKVSVLSLPYILFLHVCCLLFSFRVCCLTASFSYFIFLLFFPARRGFLDLIHSRKMPHSSWHTRSESCPLATIPQHATCHAAATAATSTTSTMLIVTGKKYENALFVIDHSLLTNITYY
jgi:hypothetical protein